MENRIVKCQDLNISNSNKICLIAGPCQLETEQHALDMAGEIKKIADKYNIGLIYKTSFDKANRTSLDGKRGAGLENSLPVFDKIKKQIKIPVLTDIHNVEQCAIVAPHIDVLQIPAFLCRQTDLLIAAAKTKKIINVKKGQFLAPWDMVNVTKKISDSGNNNILVTERGASFGYNTLVSDMRSIPIMAKNGYPIVFDATHSVQQPGGQGNKSGGQREFVEHLSRAAVAVGVAAIFIETHQDPDNAPSDGPNMVPLKELDNLISQIVQIDNLVKKKPVEFINKVISKKLKNFNIHQQEKIDNLLIRLDGTKQKKKVGANAILSVSIAVKKLSSKIKKIPIYKNLLVNKNFKLPYPMMNIINGGAHANNGLRIQEFMIRPDKAKSFSEGVRICFIVINKLRDLIKKMGHSTSVGDEGGFAPMINDNESALKLIVKAINLSGFKNGKDIVICLDVAANELIKNKHYSIHSKKYVNVDKTISEYLKLIRKYKIKSIEDPFGENDWSAWTKLLTQTKDKVQIVGDDLFVTNLERLKIGFLNVSANSILIKLNQIGTVTETLEVIKFAKLIGYKTIISHRSGDSEDTFIADFAVGTDSNQIKTGSLSRSERVSKYNQLLRIEHNLGKKSKMHNIN